MELVTLAHVTLNRIGTAGRNHVAPYKEVDQIREVADPDIATLRALIISIAIEFGEQPESLENMRQVNAWRHGAQRGEIVFNVQGMNVQWSTPHAVCDAYPALKIGKKYFKLDEIKVVS